MGGFISEEQIGKLIETRLACEVRGMDWLTAFFSDWMSPAYLFVSLLLGLLSCLLLSNKNHESLRFFNKRSRFVRFFCAMFFITFSMISLYASHGALAFQYYLDIKKFHP